MAKNGSAGAQIPKFSSPAAGMSPRAKQGVLASQVAFLDPLARGRSPSLAPSLPLSCFSVPCKTHFFRVIYDIYIVFFTRLGLCEFGKNF